MKLIVHPGAEPWQPSAVDRYKLDHKFPGDTFVAHLYPRSKANAVLGRSAEPYAFRAFTRGDVSSLFVDESETPASVAWLLAHELSHQALFHAGNKEAFAGQRGKGSPASDLYHATDAEEIACDDVAIELFGQRLDRAWWRERLRNRWWKNRRP